MITKKRNSKLVKRLAGLETVPNIIEASKIPAPNTVNRQGFAAYGLDKWLRLLSMLNTSKVEPQFYRSVGATLKELGLLIEACAKENKYLTAQCIVYSRCKGEGLRTINQVAATLLAKYLSGEDWAKRFYSLWNKKGQRGGVIFRADDIAEIVNIYTFINNKAITNQMKKGFKIALENLDTYSLLKYKNDLIDIINIVHPNPEFSKATVDFKGQKVSTFEALMKGYNVSADTWEVAQGDAGQEVAKALRENKITKTEANDFLVEAKADNWKGLLEDGKLGILAALRNIRSILSNKPDTKTIGLLCKLLSNKDAILGGKIFPYQIDLAQEVVKSEFNSIDSRTVLTALNTGFMESLPNFKLLLTGRTLVIIDMSGSMHKRIVDPNRKTTYVSSCSDKAALIGAAIAKGANADVIVFGGRATYVNYNPNQDVFTMANSFKANMGSTNLAAAWQLAASKGVKYDRVIILSDNECNRGSTYSAYRDYVIKSGSPYVYSVDMAAYGTQAILGDNVRYYYGYGNAMFQDIANAEFNASYHLDKVKEIVI